MNSHLDLLNIARRAADHAARWLRAAPAPRDPSRWSVKGPSDFVTEMDQEAERMIRESLLAALPESTVMGEELSPGARPSGLVWVVDPIDGTTNFLHGYPAYSVSIAAAVDGDLVAGVVRHVVTGDEFHAARGHGAFLGDCRLSVSSITNPAHALIGTGFPFKHLDQLDHYLDQLRRILPATSGVRRAGSAALDLADVAAGRFDGFWELMLAPWDIAAGIVLVREAGGVVTDLAGRQAGVAPTPIVAGNPAIHGWLLEMVGR